jgi:hypothetical protein
VRTYSRAALVFAKVNASGSDRVGEASVDIAAWLRGLGLEVTFAQIEERGLEAWATAEHGIAHPKPARSAVAIIRRVAGSAAKRTQPNGSILLKMTQADIARGALEVPSITFETRAHGRRPGA